MSLASLLIRAVAILALVSAGFTFIYMANVSNDSGLFFPAFALMGSSMVALLMAFRKLDS